MLVTRTVQVLFVALCASLSLSDCATPPSNCREVEKDKIVCVCNETYCDELKFDWPKEEGKALLFKSTREGHRFDVSDLAAVEVDNNEIGDDTSSETQVVGVDLQSRRQTVLGWGGAFTDATGLNVKSLSPKVADKLIRSYFGAFGLSYNFGRVPIGGSDFSTRAYSYDDQVDGADFNLTNWALANEDLQLKFPMLWKASLLSKEVGEPLKLIGSPWSPPKWMKTSNDFRRGHLINSDQVYQSYANYLVKFYKAYEQVGISFWGGTVQNEPISANFYYLFFNSLQMSSAETIKFVSKFLGPTLARNGFTRDKFKLILGDDSLGLVNGFVHDVLADAEARKHISGVGFHWYLSGFLAPYSMLDKLVNETLRNSAEFVLMTEACVGQWPWQRHLDLGNWDRAESYASDIIEDLRRGAAGWIDWNMALDLEAGPNWANNHCDSPIAVDAKKNEFYKQPMYYALGHFSRFLRPNSVVVKSQVSSGKLAVVAAHKSDSGHLVVNILNTGERSHSIQLNIANGPASLLAGVQPFSVSPRSISTLVLKL